MANWETIQTPLIPNWGSLPLMPAALGLSVAPAASSLYVFPPNHRIIIGTKEYRSAADGQVVLPTADATILTAKIATHVIPGTLVSTTA